FTAQSFDGRAGDLTQNSGGGPANVAMLPFFIGMNDPLGHNPTGEPFDRDAMTLFRDWSNGLDNGGHAPTSIAPGGTPVNRQAIDIGGVGGLNDELGLEKIPGTCTTCHDTPNIGNHSVSAPLDLGLTNAERRSPSVPLYTLRNKATGEFRRTTDPGRAIVT